MQAAAGLAGAPVEAGSTLCALPLQTLILNRTRDSLCTVRRQYTHSQFQHFSVAAIFSLFIMLALQLMARMAARRLCAPLYNVRTRELSRRVREGRACVSSSSSFFCRSRLAVRLHDSPAALPPPHPNQQPPTAHPQRRATRAKPGGAPHALLSAGVGCHA